ncbi:MAG: hypothetical protein GXY34_07415 [Syntrophomonadaceae bacterium]|nr:hypothetical protein [Syntrophomonadaceae bacterium]
MARKKVWMLVPPKRTKYQVPEEIKKQVGEKAENLIQTILKPEHIKPPPEDEKFNYIVDIYTKWYRSYFYFCSRYRCPGPNRISEFFESRFARLEYAGNERFNLSYMRYTGQWIELLTGIALDDCLEIRTNPLYFP